MTQSKPVTNVTTCRKWNGWRACCKDDTIEACDKRHNGFRRTKSRAPWPTQLSRLVARTRKPAIWARVTGSPGQNRNGSLESIKAYDKSLVPRHGLQVCVGRSPLAKRRALARCDPLVTFPHGRTDRYTVRTPVINDPPPLLSQTQHYTLVSIRLGESTAAPSPTEPPKLC